MKTVDVEPQALIGRQTRPPFRREALERLESPEPLDEPLMLPERKPFVLVGCMILVGTLVLVLARL